MLAKICLALCLLACVPAWCQTQASDAEANKPSEDDSQLQVPPPVSSQAYATTFEGESESNYLARRSDAHRRLLEQCLVRRNLRQRHELLDLADDLPWTRQLTGCTWCSTMRPASPCISVRVR